MMAIEADEAVEGPQPKIAVLCLGHCDDLIIRQPLFRIDVPFIDGEGGFSSGRWLDPRRQSERDGAKQHGYSRKKTTVLRHSRLFRSYNRPVKSFVTPFR